MTTTRVYRSTDSGAPGLTGSSAGSFVNLLRACLVNGYGSKPAAGWTEEFSATNKSVFRNSVAAGGTGCYVRVDDTGGAWSNVPITAYSSMSAIDTGDNPAAGRILRHGSSWIVVADELTCYFSYFDGSYTYRMGGFGDTEGVVAGDAYRYFVMGYEGTTTQVPAFLSGGFGSAAASSLVLPKDHTGIGSQAYYYLLRPSGSQYTGKSDLPPRPSLNAADEAAMPCYLVRSNVVRGRMRGLYMPLSFMCDLAVGAVKSGDGFGGAGSVCAALINRYDNLNYAAGLWVETALEW